GRRWTIHPADCEKANGPMTGGGGDGYSRVGSAMRFSLKPRPSPPAFRFLEPGRLVDRELELVPPSYALLEAVMASCLHPRTLREEPDAAMTSKTDLMRQLDQW